MSAKTLGAFIAAISLAAPACRREKSPDQWMKLPPELKVHLATTPEQRERGLKFRASLPGDEGMYFIFETDQPLSFYMRDTRIPLSIAFITRTSIIESIADMTPLDETPVSSAGAAQFALEVNRGWFDDNGIRPGDKVLLRQDRISFFRRVGQ